MSPYVVLGSMGPKVRPRFQSLADLGYTVDVSQADSYTITSADIAPEELGPVLELGDDVPRAPLIVVDENGA